MGIKDLNTFLKEKVPQSIKETLLNDFSGKKAAIDTSIWFYKFKYKNPRFLEGFFQQISRLRSNGITPIYIFDGIPDQAKEETINKRKDKKIEYINKIKDLQEKIADESINKLEKISMNLELKKIQKKLIRVTKEDIDSLKYLLDLMGIKYIHPNCEADIVCSKLCQNGVVDLVLSDDMDLLTSGTKTLLRDFYISSNKILEYDLDTVLSGLNLSYDEWVDFCILCGCDYVKRINGVGPKNAYKFIKNHGCIESIIEEYCGEDKKYTLPENYDYLKARTLFKECEFYKLEYNDINVEIDELFDNQLEVIKKYLRQHTNLSDKQIDNRFKKIYNK